MKHIKLKVSPYPTEIHVCTLDYPIQKKVHIDPDSAEADKSNAAETLAGKSKDGNLPLVVVRLPEAYDEVITWHESMHAAADVLKIVGVPFDSDSMDAVIYPTEYIVKTIKKRFYGIGKNGG